MICPECGVKPVQPDRDTCFRCRVATVGINFVGGGGYGREAFQRTNTEFINEFVPQGPGIEPADRGCWT